MLLYSALRSCPKWIRSAESKQHRHTDITIILDFLNLYPVFLLTVIIGKPGTFLEKFVYESNLRVPEVP